MRNPDQTRKIGIIGGMGPSASASFLNLLIRECQNRGAVLDSDFPHIILESIPFPDSNELSCGNVDEVIALTQASVDRMTAAGVEIVVAICNTIHLHIRSIFGENGPELIDITDAVAQEAKKRGYKQVIVLSSQESRDSSLYKTALAIHGIKCEYPKDLEDQEKINRIILNVMRGDIAAAQIELVQLIEKYIEQTDAVILGCTELPLAFNSDDDQKILDPNRLLAKELAKRSMEGGTKKLTSSIPSP